MPRLFLIRHGETEWAREGRHTSRTDLPLTDRGRSLATALRHRLSGLPFALVLTSPLQRARQTCELAGFREKAEIEPNLREFDYGDYEGLTSDQIRQKVPGWNVFTHPCPGGETLAQVSARADAVITRVRGASGDVLVFTHGHMGRTLAARWLAQPPEFAAALMLDTGTLNVLGTLHDVPAIQTWNAA